MKFTKLVAIIAISVLAIDANAASDGTLRRGRQVVQNEQMPAADSQQVVYVPANSPTAQQTSQQPMTVVESTPAVESKAEALRKARQDAEIQTEQKIVEKLEDARLQEERARADRLFGNKFDSQPTQQQAQPVVAPAPTPAPVVAQPPPAPPAQPANVTIEKVEIVQPAPATPPAVDPKEAAAVETKVDPPADDAASTTQKFYVGGMLGNLSYDAPNVHSNYGLGVTGGMAFTENWSVEASYLYSNHLIDDPYQYGAVYHKLDQTDVSVALKYSFMSDSKFRPFVGASASYINRKYTDRVYQSWIPNNYTNSESTQAVDVGLLGGADFFITKNFALGALIDYNFNVMTFNGIDQRGLNLPNGVQQLEKIDYWTMLVNAKFIF